MSDCLFCKIIEGEIPSGKVQENEHFFAFRDINPQAPIHVLVVPKAPVVNVATVADADLETLGRVLLAAREVAEREGVSASGFRLVINSGPDAGQEVMHLHAHLLGGRGLGWPPG